MSLVHVSQSNHRSTSDNIFRSSQVFRLALFRLGALWLSLLSYSIGIELLTLSAGVSAFPPTCTSGTGSVCFWREFRMSSPEALTFNDEFDTQGHDKESFVVGHLSAISSFVSFCPALSGPPFLEIGQMINLGYPKTINPGGPGPHVSWFLLIFFWLFFYWSSLCNSHK